MSPRLAAVLTCFNRRQKTLDCLTSLQRQSGHDAVIIPYVVDDGSTDGTGAAVRAEHPEAVVLEGDGQLYWGGGMRLALQRAAADDPDHYLWLNDDIELDDRAVAMLLFTARALEQRGEFAAIVVGSMRDPDTGIVTYGGRYRPSRIRRSRFAVLQPDSSMPTPSETMNGNLVLVPRRVVERVGNIDPGFRQQWGDQDYGLRARAAGCTVWVAPRTLGTCARNPAPVYGRKPVIQELRGLGDVKAMPPRDWARFNRRWAGPAWPVFWASPYVHRALRVLDAHRRARSA